MPYRVTDAFSAAQYCEPISMEVHRFGASLKAPDGPHKDCCNTTMFTATGADLETRRDVSVEIVPSRRL